MDLARRVVGSDAAVPVLGGGTRRFAHLDHAASTPPLLAVQQAVNEFTGWYANVHRGTGFKSRLSTWAFDEARRTVLGFVGADRNQVALFTRNTTEAINHAAVRLGLTKSQVVIATMMEHHSNDLPWRRVAEVVHVGVDARGNVDEDALRRALREHREQVVLLAVCGASNVTGTVNPVHRWAEWAHEAGARILVDGAQLVPHRPVDVRPADDPGHIDFLAFSAHKMYAPFGTGVLIGPRDVFTFGEPPLVGGGMVEIVDVDRAVYTAPPDREEAGTPCVVGALALAAAMREYQRIGWDSILDHERALTREALAGLGTIAGVSLYGQTDASSIDDRLGVIAFNVDGVPHGLAAAILGEEWAIGTRSGCFCAHPYVKSLLGISAEETLAFESRILEGDRSDVPGAVRASFGLTTRLDDVLRLIEGVRAIADGRFQQGYTLDRRHGDWTHTDACADFSAFLPSFAGAGA